MMHAPGVERARELYYSKNAGRFQCGGDDSPGEPVTDFGAGFGLPGLWQAGFNSTQQFVGDYAVDITPNADGSATFTLSNTTSMTSFGYGVFPSWEGGPGGNMSQTYTWTE